MEGMGQFNFDGLRNKLEEMDYPSVYLYKFIVPSDNKKIAQLQALFSDDAQVSLRSSKNGKYTSLGAKEVMLSPDTIIERYQKALQIEGCIAL